MSAIISVSKAKVKPRCVTIALRAVNIDVDRAVRL
jgi:hypothetical protein